MSFLLRTEETTGISNKEREYFLDLEEEDDYCFKYIPESQFKHIVKNVQRQRCRDDEERIWATFVKEQELNSLLPSKEDIHPSIQSVKDLLLRQSLQDVDTELKRLEEDALPERSKRITNCKSVTNSKTGSAEVKIPKAIKVNSSPKKMSAVRDDNVAEKKVLIPILEEEKTSKRKNNKSEESNTATRSNAKKSLSDPSITRKKRYTNQLLRAANNEDLENNSTPESNTQRDIDKQDTSYVRPDPITIQKILSTQRKIVELLDEISIRLCRIPLPDGDIDLKRRQQRAMEFAIRFSRNYLYNLNRLILSIQRHVTLISPRARLKQTRRSVALHQEAMEQKLVAAYQLLMHALTAYSNHIPSSILRGNPTKLKDVLQIFLDLNEICDKVDISSNYYGSGDADFLPGKNLQDKCDAILTKIINYNNTEPVFTLTSASKRHSSRKNLSTRLSMYSMDLRASKNDQKKMCDLRKRSHYYQKERKSCSATKTTCSQHHLIPALLFPSPVTSSQEFINIDAVKQRNYFKEDDIKTMMDGLPMDSENDSNIEIQSKRKNETSRRRIKTGQKESSKPLKSQSIEKKDKNGVIDKLVNEEKSIEKVATKDHLSTFVPVIADLMSFVSKKNEMEVQPGSEVSISVASETWKHVTNMQLIYISSGGESPRKSKCNSKHENTLDDEYKIRGAKTDGQIELAVSDEAHLHFLQYQREFQKICKSKPMYSSSTKNKPWDIVAWISDKLVEELLIEISKELQIPDVIQGMFEMEFQEF